MENLRRQIESVLLNCGHTIRFADLIVIYRANNQALEIWCPVCLSELFNQQLVEAHESPDNLNDQMEVDSE